MSGGGDCGMGRKDWWELAGQFSPYPMGTRFLGVKVHWRPVLLSEAWIVAVMTIWSEMACCALGARQLTDHSSSWRALHFPFDLEGHFGIVATAATRLRGACCGPTAVAST